jgi:hypothetical protein
VRYARWAGDEVLGHGRFVVGYAVPQDMCPMLPEVFRKASIAQHRAIQHTNAPLLSMSEPGRLPRDLYFQALKLVPLSEFVTIDVECAAGFQLSPTHLRALAMNDFLGRV